MQYNGGKALIAKQLVSFMMTYRRDNQYYIEPFMGAGNVMRHVVGNRIGSDNHYYLMEMWKAVLDGWIPPTEISEELYDTIKANQDAYPPELVGFVGHACAYGGVWFRGYARGRGGYAKNGSNSLVKKKPAMEGVELYCCSYDKLEIPPNSLIYCDPPYAHSEKYRKQSFDHDIFWQWVRSMWQNGHIVFVSEFNAPSDFVSVLDIPRRQHIQKSEKNVTDKLFIWNP